MMLFLSRDTLKVWYIYHKSKGISLTAWINTERTWNYIITTMTRLQPSAHPIRYPGAIKTAVRLK